MPLPEEKGKEKVSESGGILEVEKEAAERQKRSFERSLAGPSVGKAGELWLPQGMRTFC